MYKIPTHPCFYQLATPIFILPTTLENKNTNTDNENAIKPRNWENSTTPSDSKQLIFLQLPAYKSNDFLTQYWESNTFLILLL